MKRIKVRDITGLNTLAGRSSGSRDFPKLLAAVEDSPEGSTVIVDWTGVEIATASYFGATFVRLLRMTMTGDVDRYVILRGLNPTCLDELKLALELPRLVALLGDVNDDGSIRSVRLVGSLESSYVEAFGEVQRLKAVSASELHKRQDRMRGPIGKTGWINRLSNLHKLRLVRKERVGREFLFKTVSEEM